MIDSAVHNDEETNEDITNRVVGRSDQHTKRLKNENYIQPFDGSEEISPYVEKTMLIDKNAHRSEMNQLDFNINLSDRNNSLRGLDSLKDKDFNLKKINYPHVQLIDKNQEQMMQPMS